MTLINILVATFVISLIAFVGVLTFVLKKELLNKALLVLVALSTGALLGGAFLHLLPAAIAEKGADLAIFLYLLLAPISLELLMLAKTSGAILFGIANAFVPIVIAAFLADLSGIAWSRHYAKDSDGLNSVS